MTATPTAIDSTVAEARRAMGRYEKAVDRVQLAAERLADATARRQASEAAYLAKWGRMPSAR